MNTIEEGRERAERLAEACLRGLLVKKPVRWLRDEYLAGANCWLFLKSREMVFLPGCESSADMAFVVSFRGTLMSVADHGEDMRALRQHLLEISAYLGRRDEYSARARKS